MQRSGRGPNELRRVRVERRYLKHALGSCLIDLGDTRVLCAATITEGVGAWRRGTGLGWITAEYSMLPAATHQRTNRERGAAGTKGRTHEIQRLIGRSLRSVIDLSGMGGESTLTVDCDVIQADGGTRTAAITGAFLAAHDALAAWQDAGKIKQSPIVDHVAATSVGIVDGVVLLDLDYSEDSVAEVDMNVVMDGRGRFVEVQGTGEAAPFARERLDGLLDAATQGVMRLVELQRAIIAEDADEWTL